ncbi:PfkB family carbohydrate kinase [Arsenicicoccus piscis]|uniref:PfkB family carbohydrate kinase n=1 Tax=Arsenicicoccus piscis TaxID=673954 RepID=UPI001F4D1059|nr:PfkB family carbohydrate kinase [Arsenicicoccus piscis]MCH8628109.1 PfkB family carbohydrate kinase [Arsenicicoccus piscis]
MGRLFVLGSLTVETVTRVERTPRPGDLVLADALERRAAGRGGNQAVAAATSGLAPVTLVGAVGADAAGEVYRERLVGLGVDVRGVATVPEATGMALVTVDADGERAGVLVPGANALLGPEHLDVLDQAQAGDVLLVSLEVPRRSVAMAVRMVAAKDVRVIVNAAPFAELPAEVMAEADPLVVNEHEARQLADTGALPASLLVTFGAHGVSWNGVEHPAHPVDPDEVVDAAGAGDAFCGVLAAGLAGGLPQDEALTQALAAGAAAVRHVGAQASGLLAEL